MSSRFNTKNILILFISSVICVLLLYSSPSHRNKRATFSSDHANHGSEHDVMHKHQGLENENFLDGCYHVYLDVGSNIGTQIRKLFEPEKYPGSNVLSIFDSQFGPIQMRRKTTNENGGRVCAVGFEPNSHHTRYLKKLEAAYNNCNMRVKMLVETAASDHNGTARFFTDEAYRNFEWGGGILPPNISNIAIDKVSNKRKSPHMNVTLIRLSDFLKNVVAKRKYSVPSNSISNSILPPKVVMKMDIEGSEIDVIPDLIFTGGLQYINHIMIEWHERLELVPERKRSHKILENIIESLGNYSATMKNHGSKFDFNLVNLDDEGFSTSKFDLPVCN